MGNPSKHPRPLFSKGLSDELSSILGAEFKNCAKGPMSIEEIGLRIVEFVALKERRRDVSNQ